MKILTVKEVRKFARQAALKQARKLKLSKKETREFLKYAGLWLGIKL